MQTKAVLYARVSSDRQEKEGFSIPAQVKFLKDYSKNNNIKIVEEFVEAETAKRAGRTKFNEMLKYLKKHKDVRAILVEKTDRLYRNLKDYVLLDEFDGLEIHFAKEGNILSQNSKSQDKFMHGIRVLMAKNYIDNLSEEIRKGLKEKCSQGYYPSALPIGYINKSNQSGRKEIVLSSDAPFVKEIFEKYLLENHSYKSLAEYMNSVGFFPKNRECTNKTIENILHNEFYTGIFFFKGEKYYNAKHPAIITPELYWQVQNKIKNKYKTVKQKRKFAYSSFIKCGCCGRALIGELQHGGNNSGEYIYYRCHRCKGMSIKECEIETSFYEDILKKLHFSTQFKKEVIEIAKELVHSENEFAEKSMTKLHDKIQILRKRLSKLYTDRCDEIVDDITYMTLRSQWQQELDKSLVKYEKINNASKDFIENLENLSNLCKSAPERYLSQSQEERRKLMDLVMSNPILRGSNLVFTVHSAFEYALKLHKLEMVGVEPTSKMDLNKSLRV